MIAHLHTDAGWDRGLYEIIVQCPPFPLILLLFFEFVSLCFHVLLVIRLSAGLYWITPEAHQRINDVGSERGTHKYTMFDKVPSLANNRNVMNFIEIIKGHEWRTKLN